MTAQEIRVRLLERVDHLTNILKTSKHIKQVYNARTELKFAKTRLKNLDEKIASGVK